MTNAMEELLRK